MDPHLCEHRPLSRKPAVPRRLNAPTPNVGDRRGGNPRPRTGCPSCTVYSGPAGRHAMVVAHFFESGQLTPSTLGPKSRSAPLIGRRSSAGQHRVHSCDRRKGLGLGPTSARPGRPGFPTQREPALPTETAREQKYARRKVESSFWSGGWIAAQLRPAGDRL